MRKQKLTPDQVRVSQEQKLRAQTVPNKKRYDRNKLRSFSGKDSGLSSQQPGVRIPHGVLET